MKFSIYYTWNKGCVNASSGFDVKPEYLTVHAANTACDRIKKENPDFSFKVMESEKSA